MSSILVQIKNVIRLNQSQTHLDLIFPMQLSLGNDESFLMILALEKSL